MNFENNQSFDLKENTKILTYQQACQPVRQGVLEFYVSLLISKPVCRQAGIVNFLCTQSLNLGKKYFFRLRFL